MNGSFSNTSCGGGVVHSKSTPKTKESGFSNDRQLSGDRVFTNKTIDIALKILVTKSYGKMLYAQHTFQTDINRLLNVSTSIYI